MSILEELLKPLLGSPSTPIPPHIIHQRPLFCEGHTINYSEPYWDPCPYHGCTTYQTKEDPHLCYCPECNRLLKHY